MYAVGKLGSYISRGVVTVAAPFHPFGGAVDIVVVEQEDGSFKSSPWYVQFGKFQGVLKAREKVVSINVNGFDADFRMYLDSRGGAYFPREADKGEGESGSWGDNEEALSNLRRPKKIMSCNYDLQRSKTVSEFEAGNAKVTRSSSTGPRILGFVFGQRSEDGDDSRHQDDAIRRDREGSLERAEIAADLLEVRWSTSLATSKQKKETDSHNSDQHSSVQTPSGADNDTGSKTYSSTRPHSNGFHNNSIDGGGTEIPLSIDPSNFMESFTLEEKHFGVNGVSKSSVGSNVGDARIIQHEEGAYKSDASGISSSNSLLSSGNEHPSTFQIRDADDDSKITIVQSSKVCEVSNGFIEGVDDPTGEHCISANGSKSSAVTHDGVPTVLETKVEVTLDCKTNEGPVKYVEEMVLDQVSTNRERSLTNSLLVEEATSAALNLMENLKSEKHCGSPPTNSTHPGSCENHDEAQFVFSDLESLERKVALTVDKEAEKNPQHHPGRSEEKLDGSTQISRTTSNPISIAGARDQVDQIAPIVDTFSSSWSHGVEINPEDVNHPISRSLDSSFDNMMLVQGDVPSTSDTGTQEQQTTPRKSSLEQYQISDKLKELLSDPAVEISLCRHSVHEGMGYEAAAHAFDSEKLDVEKFISLGPDVIKNDKVVVRIGGLYFPWDAALPIVSAIGAPRGEQILEPKGMIHVQHVENAVESYPQQSMDSSNGTWKLWPFKRTMSRKNSVVADATSSQRFPAGNTETPKSNTFRSDTFKSETIKKNVGKANTPTSDQLESLNLKYGRNVVTFTFSTPMLGEQKVDAQIYLWKWNARIVISDVDGTITKSDVLGQFMPMVGVDWSQTGVTHLFSAIKKNGYQLLFLSARAISQASLTRQFLFNLKQDGIALPEGPVVISPDGLFPSLFREVIRRAPHEFKIACLEDIKALFPLDHSPFYAGFGNRDTDEISYVKVGIPKGKVFIINPKGEVAVHRCVDTKSYTSLHDLVHEMFPHPTSVPHTEKEDYNNWNFWRLPPPDVLP